MELDINSIEFWQTLGLFLGLAALIIGAIISSLWSGATIVIQWKKFRAAIKLNADTIYAQIDQGTDLFPATIAQLTPSKTDTGEMYSAMFKAMFETMFKYTPPPQGVNISAPEATPSDLTALFEQATQENRGV